MRISPWIAGAALAASFLHAAMAASFQPFTTAAFSAAQQAGKPIVVEVYAPWCPICARQQPILNALEQSTTYSDVIVLRVDFDSQTDVLEDLRVVRQSTLIGYHGKTETGRLVGVVRKDKIEELVAAAQKG